MRRIVTASLSTIACAIALGFLANAQIFGDIKRGETLSRNLCSECHAVNPGEVSRNTVAPSFETIASSTGMTGLALEAALQTTHRLMPNIMLESSDRSDVIAYIESLKARN